MTGLQSAPCCRPMRNSIPLDGVDGVSAYRYAYINDAPVLVEPGSRQIIEVIE